MFEKEQYADKNKGNEREMISNTMEYLDLTGIVTVTTQKTTQTQFGVSDHVIMVCYFHPKAKCSH